MDDDLSQKQKLEQVIFHQPITQNQLPKQKGSSLPGNADKIRFGKNFLKRKVFIFGIIVFSVVVFLFTLSFRIKNSKNVSTTTKKGELVWWGVQHDPAVFQPLIEEFEKKNPNIKIKYTKQSNSDYRERLANSLKQGTGPDIFEIHNTWPYMFKDSLSSLPSQIMSKEEFEKSFYPVIVSDVTLPNLGMVAMPLEFDALTLFINEDIFILANLDPPEVWDEVGSLAHRLSLKGAGGIVSQAGVAMGITQNVDHWQEIVGLLLIQNRVNPASPIGDRAKTALNFYKSFKEGEVWDDALPPSTVAFANSKVAMYFAPTRRAQEIVKLNPNLKFRTLRLPQLRKNLPTDPDFSYATYWVQAVSVKSQNQEIAWEFLKFLSSPESLREINSNISKLEVFPRLYPRPEMNLEFREHPVLGSVASLAYNARSWFLADQTFDGQKGINSLIGKIFENLLAGSINDRVLGGSAQDIKKILSSYGIATK